MSSTSFLTFIMTIWVGSNSPLTDGVWSEEQPLNSVYILNFQCCQSWIVFQSTKRRIRNANNKVAFEINFPKLHKILRRSKIRWINHSDKNNTMCIIETKLQPLTSQLYWSHMSVRHVENAKVAHTVTDRVMKEK